MNDWRKGNAPHVCGSRVVTTQEGGDYALNQGIFEN